MAFEITPDSPYLFAGTSRPVASPLKPMPVLRPKPNDRSAESSVGACPKHDWAIMPVPTFDDCVRMSHGRMVSIGWLSSSESGNVPFVMWSGTWKVVFVVMQPLSKAFDTGTIFMTEPGL